MKHALPWEPTVQLILDQQVQSENQYRAVESLTNKFVRKNNRHCYWDFWSFWRGRRNQSSYLYIYIYITQRWDSRSNIRRIQNRGLYCQFSQNSSMNEWKTNYHKAEDVYSTPYSCGSVYIESSAEVRLSGHKQCLLFAKNNRQTGHQIVFNIMQ